MKLTEKVIKLDCTNGSHAYAIIHDGITLIDSSLPGRGDAILNELKSYGYMPSDIKRILITHSDIDHIGNVGYLMDKCNCEVYIDKIELPYALGIKKRDGIKRILGIFMKVHFPDTVKTFETQLISGIEVIKAIGHTRGHTSFRFNDVFFAGDLLGTKDGKIALPPKIITWDLRKNMESCKDLNLDGIEWICPAHGEPVKKADSWKLFVDGLI